MISIAGLVSERATCGRLRVGTIVTDSELTTIVSIGYNGTARGLLNGCDRDVAGDCGCVHAEANALVKAPYGPSLKLFTTHTPCAVCAKLLINATVRCVYAYQAYRDDAGVRLLWDAAIPVYLWDRALRRFRTWDPAREVR